MEKGLIDSTTMASDETGRDTTAEKAANQETQAPGDTALTIDQLFGGEEQAPGDTGTSSDSLLIDRSTFSENPFFDEGWKLL